MRTRAAERGTMRIRIRDITVKPEDARVYSRFRALSPAASGEQLGLIAYKYRMGEDLHPREVHDHELNAKCDGGACFYIDAVSVSEPYTEGEIQL